MIKIYYKDIVGMSFIKNENDSTFSATFIFNYHDREYHIELPEWKFDNDYLGIDEEILKDKMERQM